MYYEGIPFDPSNPEETDPYGDHAPDFDSQYEELAREEIAWEAAKWQEEQEAAARYAEAVEPTEAERAHIQKISSENRDPLDI